MKRRSATWLWAASVLLACGCTALVGLDAPYHLADGGSGGEGLGGGGCEPGEQDACYSGPAGTLNRGSCRAGVRTCAPEGDRWGACVGEVTPEPERCDTPEDEDCDGTGCTYDRCDALPDSFPAGVYSLDPDGPGPQEALSAYCDVPIDGERWALVYNSVGSEDGRTLPFWRILYADRLGSKGEPSLRDNHYQGALYLAGQEYRDEVEDLGGVVEEVMRATAEGIDPATMRLLNPLFISGNQQIFDWQFAAGWSSPDFDGDTDDDNCAVYYAGVTQHYAHCFVYNLGADADLPYEDDGFGPHIETAVAASFGLTGEPEEPEKAYTRVKRISRWARW